MMPMPSSFFVFPVQPGDWATDFQTDCLFFLTGGLSSMRLESVPNTRNSMIDNGTVLHAVRDSQGQS